MTPYTTSILNTILRKDLGCFIAKTFATVNPGSQYLNNWHIELIASKLEQVYRGKIRRLVINMPPRSLKSICVSVAWPAWILGNSPNARIMAASYSSTLSTKHSVDTRLVMLSDWYKSVFPSTIISQDQNEKNKFTTTERGFRFATSVGGTATGEGADFLIVDDPLNPVQAASNIMRQNVIEWFSQTFSTRLNNKKKGAIIVVMQRLHVDDLTGYLLKKRGWEVLSLPAIFDKSTTYSYCNNTKTTNIGEYLHHEREGKEEIELAKIELGSYGFSAQYQQSPILVKGGMVEKEWLKRFNLPENEIINTQNNIYQSWDTAIKSGNGNDYSVCTTWQEKDNAYYLLDLYQEKLEYPALKRTVTSLAQKYQPKAILIEDKASGQSLIQDLRITNKLPLIAIMPNSDKITRFARITPLFEAGIIFLPNSAKWLVDFEAQLLSFPNYSHDDIVDSISQFLNWISKNEGRKPKIRRC